MSCVCHSVTLWPINKTRLFKWGKNKWTLPLCKQRRYALYTHLYIPERQRIVWSVGYNCFLFTISSSQLHLPCGIQTCDLRSLLESRPLCHHGQYCKQLFAIKCKRVSSKYSNLKLILKDIPSPWFPSLFILMSSGLTVMI